MTTNRWTPTTIKMEHAEAAARLYAGGATVSYIASSLDVGRQTVYDYLDHTSTPLRRPRRDYRRRQLGTRQRCSLIDEVHQCSKDRGMTVTEFVERALVAATNADAKAAPDMLEALEVLADEAGRVEGASPEAIEKARAAIAKAKGTP